VQAVASARASLYADILSGNSTSTDISDLESSETALADIQATIWLAIRTDLGAGSTGSAQLTTLDDIANNLGKHHGRFGRHHVFWLLHKLDLTKEQKSRIADIFSSNKSDLKTAAVNLASARVQLRQDILLGSGSAAIGKDLTALTQAQSAMVTLQVKIWTDIRTDLSGSPQLTTLNNLAAKISKGAFITAALQKRFAVLEAWVAKHK
jgi:Spy/CpxP family protein refolding chaperone